MSHVESNAYDRQPCRPVLPHEFFGDAYLASAFPCFGGHGRTQKVAHLCLDRIGDSGIRFGLFNHVLKIRVGDAVRLRRFGFRQLGRALASKTFHLALQHFLPFLDLF
ncbi:MAG TPA: hypothetical protein VMY35_19125 [Phycisphaerae bacterium]|nr:hypothetical protein [Phycisphaerae bacterium]